MTHEKIKFAWESLDVEGPKPTNSAFLTGLNTGVYLAKCVIKYIMTFDSIVDISSDPKYHFDNRGRKIAVSYDENVFVLTNYEGLYEFYRIDDDF